MPTLSLDPNNTDPGSYGLLYDGDTAQQTGTITDGTNSTGYVIDYAYTGSSSYYTYMGDVAPGFWVTGNDSKATPFMNIKFQDDPTTPTEVNGFTFGIGDVDYSESSFRDAVRIEAFDANGDPVDVIATGLAAHHQIDNGNDGTGGVLEVYGTDDLSGINNTGPMAGRIDGFTVSFAGPVSEVRVYQYFINDGYAPDTDVITIDDASFDTINVVCFAAGTRIETDQGEKPVEDLARGDLVRTLDGALRPIRWVGKRDVSMGERAVNPKLHPVRIMAGAMGDGLPERDLVVSRQHRMLVRSRIAERMFGSHEVLVPAIKLTEMPGIFVDESVEKLEYCHILLDGHDIVLAEGAPSETLFTGPEALKAVSPEAREEIMTLFPEVASPEFANVPARPIPQKGRAIRRLVARHRSAGRQLFARDG